MSKSTIFTLEVVSICVAIGALTALVLAEVLA